MSDGSGGGGGGGGGGGYGYGSHHHSIHAIPWYFFLSIGSSVLSLLVLPALAFCAGARAKNQSVSPPFLDLSLRFHCLSSTFHCVFTAFPRPFTAFSRPSTASSPPVLDSPLALHRRCRCCQPRPCRERPVKPHGALPSAVRGRRRAVCAGKRPVVCYESRNSGCLVYISRPTVVVCCGSSGRAAALPAGAHRILCLQRHDCAGPHNMVYNPTRWPSSPRIVMRCTPRASNGPRHLGLCALQAAELGTYLGIFNGAKLLLLGHVLVDPGGCTAFP